MELLMLTRVALQLLGLPKDYNQTEIMRAMTESWYCLQPTGDSPTRAHVFDCLAAGPTNSTVCSAFVSLLNPL